MRSACAAIDSPLCLIVYSDNIGVLVPSREAALATSAALTRVLAGHEAGPFRVGKRSIDPVSKGFDYLGYRWTRSAAGVIAAPAPGRIRRWEAPFLSRVSQAWGARPKEALGDGQKEFDALGCSVEGFAAAYREWPNA
jgi:hypothetical protein